MEVIKARSRNSVEVENDLTYRAIFDNAEIAPGKRKWSN